MVGEKASDKQLRIMPDNLFVFRNIVLQLLSDVNVLLQFI